MSRRPGPDRYTAAATSPVVSREPEAIAEMLHPDGYRVVQTLHEGAAMLLLRARREGDDRPVIIKTHGGETGSDVCARHLRNEARILRRLPSGITCSLIAERELNGHAALITEDVGGESLDKVLESRSLSILECLEVAHGIASALEVLHEHALIHRRINPRHVIWNATTGAVRLIGLGAASEPPAVPGLGGITPDVAALAYVSPEQAGKLDHDISYASDLYSLGATLYTLLLREPPFGGADELEIVAAHMTQQIQPPTARRAQVPEPLSRLVLRLMEKRPEDRYRSAASVRADLAWCLESFRTRGTIEDGFAPDSRTVDATPGPMLRIYGRAVELAAMEQFHHGCLEAGHGLIAVTGESGIGKSTLVHFFGKRLEARGVLFCAGKSDRRDEGSPYLTIERPLNALLRRLGANVETSTHLRQRILQALGPDAEALFPIVRALRAIVGPQPEATGLPAEESRHRRHLLFHRLLIALAQDGAPVTIFLDDLQWSDRETLDLLAFLAATAPLSNVVFVVAYRSTELDADHPVQVMRGEVARTDTRTLDIALKGLEEDAVARMTAQALDADRETLDALSRRLHAQSCGNPLHLQQLIADLGIDRGDGLPVAPVVSAAFDVRAPGSGADAVGARLSQRLRALPPRTRELLEYAACLGSSFRVDELSRVVNRSLEEVRADLDIATEEGFVTALRPAVTTGGEGAGAPEPAAHFRFFHDQAQASAYGSIARDELGLRHLTIARRLESGGGDAQDVTQMVDHFNLALEQVTDRDEMLRVAGMNRAVAHNARSTGAYHTALLYIRWAQRWLPEGANLAREDQGTLYLERADLEFRTGDPEQGFRFAKRALDVLEDRLNVASVQEMLIIQHTLRNEYETAIRIGREALEALGLALPHGDGHEELEAELGRAARVDAERYLRNFSDLAVSDSRVVRVQMRILISLLAPTYFRSPILNNWIEAKMVNLSEEHGYCRESAKGLVNLGGLLSKRGQRRRGYALARLGLEVADELGAPELRPKILYTLANAIGHWVRPLSEVGEIADQAFDACQEMGYLDYAGYVLAFTKTLNWVYRSEPLPALQGRLTSALRYAERTRNGLARSTILAVIRVVAALQDSQVDGATGPGGDDDAFLQDCRRNGHFLAVCVYHQLSALAALGTADGARAAEQAARSGELIGHVSSSMPMAIQPFLAAAAALMNAEHPVRFDQGEVHEAIGRIGDFARDCPENFGAMDAYLRAELDRARGRYTDAMTGYQETMRKGQGVGFPPMPALAAQRAADLFRSLGLEDAALAYANLARDGYRRWGGRACVEALEERYPRLRDTSGQPAPGGAEIRTTDLDLAAVLKFSKAIVSELRTGDLFDTLLAVLMEAAGADRGIFVLVDGESARVEVVAEAGESFRSTHVSTPLARFPDIARSMVRRALRSGTTEVLDRRADGRGFPRDPYLEEAAVGSAICLPIVEQRQVTGIVYLENRLTAGAFTSSQLDLLNILASHAAIAIRNALVFSTLEDKVSQRTVRLEEANQSAQEARIAAEAANKAKTDFLANVSHELRTPLNAVIGFSDMLREQIFGPLNAKQLEYVEDINSSGQHLLDLITDILDMSKVESGHMELEYSSFDVRDLITGAMAIVAPRAREKEIALEHVVAADLGVIRADARRIKQVVLNVMSNAVKFTPPGGRVEVSAVREAGHLRVAISDTGIGIPPDHLESVFRPFHRVETNKEYASGTGLGLSLSRQLVELHGGVIGVESTLGEGSTFTVSIPYAP